MSSNISLDPIIQLQDETNLNRYKAAGVITSKVLDIIVPKCIPGTNVFELCQEGDKIIMEKLSEVHKDCKYKGVAFPTCISINNCAGFFSPLPDDQTIIKEGDLVKIELGVHIDGFPALICYTVLVNNGEPISDKRANVLKAVADASKQIVSVMKPDTTNIQIAKIMNDVASKYQCNLPLIQVDELAPGTMSHQISRGIIDGSNNDDDEFIHQFVLAREGGAYDFTMNEIKFEEDEVYAIDILMSTGTGKIIRKDAPTTIMKRVSDTRINFRLNSSKSSLSVFPKNRFPIALSKKMDPKFRLGIKECISKGVVQEYPVLYEKDKEFIARVKFTVIVKKTPILITGRSADSQLDKIKL
jgi:curved DNA binding protein